MKALILALMTLLVPPSHQKYNGETEDEAAARYAIIADAIAEEADGDQDLAVFMVAVARHESGFVKKVHAGKQRGDAGQSWGLFQVMVPGSHYDKWARIKDHPREWRAHQIAGLDEEATERAAWTAAWILRKKIDGCQGEPTCVFKAYGGIKGRLRGKTKKRILARVNSYQKLRAFIARRDAAKQKDAP